jgi:AAA domain
MSIANFIIPSVVPPARAINSIVHGTLDRLRTCDNDLAKLQAVRSAAEALYPYGDAAIEARVVISDSAITAHDLNLDAVQAAMAKGIEMAQTSRAPVPPVETKPSADWWQKELIDPHQLCDQQFPELRYVVPGLLPEGVTLLASRPKLGKSWLLLQIGLAVANGVATLVSSDKPVCGDVLYLALEDSPRRLKRRMQKYCGLNRDAWPRRFAPATSWKRLDEGGLDALRAWCKSVEKPTLILIDVLKRVRAPRGRNQSDYDADYEACRGLQELAGELGITIIVAHHDRKMDAEDVFDTVSGTLGLTGGVDAIAVMKRKGAAVTLHIEGRDLTDTVEKAINFDRETCRWTILGEAAEVQRSGERQRFLTALGKVSDGMSVGEIVAAASLVSRNAADNLLFHMLRNGEVSRVKRGVYSLPGIAMTESGTKIAKKQRSELNTPKDQGDFVPGFYVERWAEQAMKHGQENLQ